MPIEEFHRGGCFSFLIAKCSNDEEARRELDHIASEVFERTLWYWCRERETWPQDRTPPIFWQWFNFYHDSMLVDYCDYPLDKEYD